MLKATAPTLADVAQHAGVNSVTASIVLSGGRGNTRVSEATRQRILASARDLQYQPNALARSLRNRKTHIIGFYLSALIDTRNLFLSEIVSGLHAGCEQHRRDFLIHGTFRGDSTEDILAELLNGKVDGLAVHVSADDPLTERLAACHLPVVALANPVSHLPSVTADDAKGAQMLVEHLARQGHRAVLYGVCPFPLSSATRRYEAFCHSAAARDIRVTTSSTFAEDYNGVLTAKMFVNMPVRERPTAIACWNDDFAYHLIGHLHTQGVRVPDDVAVVGFDGSTSEIPPAYRLTTIRAPWRQVAQTVISLLVDQREGQTLPMETMLPVEFVAGDTG